MKLEHLRYLQALRTSGSINKCANLCYTSPQNVSRILRNLEEELGTALVQRTLSGVEFTEAGLAAVEMAEKISRLVDDFQLQFCEKAQTEGSLSVYFTKIQSALFLEDLVRKFPRLYPNIHLHFVENDYQVCLKKIQQENRAIGLLPITADTDALKSLGMEEKMIGSERVAILVGPESSLRREKNISFSQISGNKFVIYSRNNMEDGFWHDILQHAIKNVKDVFIASNGYLFFNKVLQEHYVGLGCEKASFLSESMRNQEIRSRISIIPINDEKGIFHHKLVVPEALKEDGCVSCLYDFLRKTYES